MKISFELLPPTMPNFIAYKAGIGQRQDGFKPEQNRIDVKDLTREQAEEYADLMKQAFIQHWEGKSGQAIAGLVKREPITDRFADGN